MLREQMELTQMPGRQAAASSVTDRASGYVRSHLDPRPRRRSPARSEVASMAGIIVLLSLAAPLCGQAGPDVQLPFSLAAGANERFDLEQAAGTPGVRIYQWESP